MHTAVAILGTCAGVVAVAACCRAVLHSALDGEVNPTALSLLWMAAAAFFGLCGLVAVTQGVRLAQRVAGPSRRLCEALRTIATGDLSFRVHFRHGDHLRDVAAELNRTLDWLNRHPPSGATTGSDVVEMEHDEVFAGVGEEESW